jgi:hypothetical protein
MIELVIAPALYALILANPVLTRIPAVLNSKEHSYRSVFTQAFVPNLDAGVL